MDAPPHRYHLMIVGIDAYVSGVRPLNGCVNDAQEVVALLMRHGVSEKEVGEGLFLAPREGRTVSLPFRAPTRANLIARLQELAMLAEPGDHVWIYYSGHGSQCYHPDPKSSAMFEALVPVDFTEKGENLLYDFELARLLQGIGRGKTIDSVTVILDCCNSAGATKNLPPSGAAVGGPSAERFVTLPREVQARLLFPVVSADENSGIAGIAVKLLGEPTLIAACHADERAREDAATGTWHGILTSSLLKILKAYDQQGKDLRSLRWADIWLELCHEIRQRNPQQRPWSIGTRGRPCLGGRGIPYDPGISIVAEGSASGAWRLDAGSLLGIRVGSLIAVYEADPPLFAPLNSTLDISQRVATLRIERVELLEAFGRPAPGTALPRAARGRLTNPNLSVYLAPGAAQQLDPAALTAAAERRFLQLQLSSTALEAELQVERLPDGSYGLGDAVNPPKGSANGALPMAILPGHDAAKETLDLLVSAFLHYSQYVTPLRMARLAAQGGKSVLARDQLLVDLIACSGLTSLELNALHENLHTRVPLPAKLPGVYELRVSDLDDNLPSPDRFCLWVRNRSGFSLYVSVFDCNVDGQLEELLVNEQLPEGDVGKLIWWRAPAEPYDMRLGSHRLRGIDRLVIVASSIKGGHGLESLKQAKSLQDATVGDRSARGSAKGEAQDRPTAKSPSVSNTLTAWTAVEVALDLRLQ